MVARVIHLSLAFGFFFFLLAKSTSPTHRPLTAYAAGCALAVALVYLCPQSRFAWAALGAGMALFLEQIIKRAWPVWRQEFSKAGKKGRK